MAGLSLEAHFAGRPLTGEEASSGTALRVSHCLRSDEGRFEDGPASFVWVVLSCARAGSRPHAPRCVALEGRGRLVRGVRLVRPELLASHEVTLGGEAWSVDEYSVCVPDSCRRFVVVAGGRREVVGNARRGELFRAYAERISNASVDPGYPDWLARSRAARLALPVPAEGPLMSIVTPAFRTPPALLRETLGSVLAQTYGRWELVVVNASPGDSGMREVLSEFADPRVKVVDTPENLGIVGNTNLGISQCAGDYVSFFDHDDLLEPHALAELVRAVRASGGRAGLLYCDEDNVDESGSPMLPLLKPGYNPDLLLSNNYAIHWLTVRRDLLGGVELSGRDVEGAQDYDLTFKVAELGAEVVHVPHVLYHWRICAGSSAGDPASKLYAQDAGARAIEGHLARAGVAATVSRGSAYFTYRTDFSVPSPAPSLRVVCPGGPSAATRAAAEAYGRARGAAVSFDAGSVAEPSRIDAAGADLLLLVTPEHDLDPSSLELLVGRASAGDVLAVAPRVVRADGLLDYAGMVVRPDGTLGHLLRHLPQGDGGYVGRAQRPYDALAVNPECCLVVSRALSGLSLAGGFSTPAYGLAEAFVAGYLSGLRNVYLPYATARLSAPRTLLDEGGPRPADAERLLGLFPQLACGDMSHNPNFDPWSGYYRLHWGDPAPRAGAGEHV